VLSGSGGGNPKLKGDDFLHEAMRQVAEKMGDCVQLLVFGQPCPPQYKNLAYKTHWLGSVKDDFAMATIYSAADLMVVPSRQDNLPNTAVEANACETPVVAFNIGGLPDIVEHKVSGWLAKPFEVEDLAAGIQWLLEDPVRLNAFSKAARHNIESKFSPKVIVDQYLRVYEDAIGRSVL
jgi:glycosyltransferase involved in cell wall biosynthesis